MTEKNPFAFDPEAAGALETAPQEAAVPEPAKALKVPLRRSAEGTAPAPEAFVKKPLQKGKLSVKSGSGKISLPKFEGFRKSALAIFMMYAALCGIAAYAFENWTWDKISRIPTARASLQVSKDNLAKQKKEKEYLDSLSVDDKDLSEKEARLASYFPKDHPKLRLAQAAAIDALAEWSGISVASFQKLEEPKDEGKVEKLSEALESAGLKDFSEDLWYAKYNLEIVGDEDSIMRFMEEAERVPAISVESFSITRSASDVRYSVVLKYHYIVPVTE